MGGYLAKEFDTVSEEEIDAWHEKYSRIDSPYKGFHEANLDKVIWILKDRDSILKVYNSNNSVAVFHKEKEGFKKR